MSEHPDSDSRSTDSNAWRPESSPSIDPSQDAARSPNVEATSMSPPPGRDHTPEHGAVTSDQSPAPLFPPPTPVSPTPGSSSDTTGSWSDTFRTDDTAGPTPGQEPDRKPGGRWKVPAAILSLVLIGGGAAVLLNNRDGDGRGSVPTNTTTADRGSSTSGSENSGDKPDTGTDDAKQSDGKEAKIDPAAASADKGSGLRVSNGHETINVHRPIVDVAAVSNTVAPSVVTVSADVEGALGPGGAVGTGVLVTEDGNILTNAHVVEGATAVRVRLAGTTEPVKAQVLASDKENDLALLDIDGSGYTPAVFANPKEVRVGDPVVAIGFALDLDGGPSVTLGIVSAVNRTLAVDQNQALDGLIQTDAAISSGNSGGPLVNAAGEVVGINTAVARGDAFTAASNVGFAISVDEILQVVPDLRDQANGDTRETGYLGVALEPRVDGGQGALVGQVEPGTPAAAAGLRAGDVVLAVDGVPINGGSGLRAAIRDREPGDKVTIKVLRKEKTLELSAVLAKAPET